MFFDKFSFLYFSKTDKIPRNEIKVQLKTVYLQFIYNFSFEKQYSDICHSGQKAHRNCSVDIKHYQ